VSSRGILVGSQIAGSHQAGIDVKTCAPTLGDAHGKPTTVGEESDARGAFTSFVVGLNATTLVARRIVVDLLLLVVVHDQAMTTDQVRVSWGHL
jgi:hypothetical protein